MCAETGLVCPRGTVCNGQGDACVLRGCGDGVAEEDLEEECDDGNAVSGDGCSVTCKIELCGNGDIDATVEQGGVLLGEQCEDGFNGLERDGCTSQCRAPEARWVRVGQRPPAVSSAAGVYDAARRRIVVFGGFSAQVSGGREINETWEWDGAHWYQRTSDWTPPPRFGHAMAYESRSAGTVLFGGFGAGGALGDTWRWNGYEWRSATAGNAEPSPPARGWHAMAYDSKRQRVVLFGGTGDARDPDALLDDIWEWDGVRWMQIEVAEAPPARFGHSMTYDPRRGLVVLVGGRGGGDERLADVWLWDGVSWTEQAVSDGPAARSGHQVAYDAAAGAVIVFGGSRADLQRPADTWLLDAEGWTSVVTAGTPPVRDGHVMAYDISSQRTVVFGGAGEGMILSDTWSRGAGDWESVDVVGAGPSARFAHAMAHDNRRSEVLLFGGADVAGSRNDLWRWNGRRWIESPPADESGGPPLARYSHALVYDSRRDRYFLFGGQSNDGVLGDSWVWDPKTQMWSEVPAVGGRPPPPARFGHEMVYDPLRDVIVLYGGSAADTNGCALDDRWADTWEWSEASGWEMKVPAPRQDFSSPVGNGCDNQAQQSYEPPAPGDRDAFAMVYDSKRSRVILFGGALGPGFEQQDAWVWDGSAWSEVPFSGLTLPAPRASHAVAFDQVNGELVVFGGTRFSQGKVADFYSDTWAGDGAGWQQRASGPVALLDAAAAYDGARGEVVLFGGSSCVCDTPTDDPEAIRVCIPAGCEPDVPVYSDETWLFSTGAVGPEACDSGLDADGDGLVGCDDPDCWALCTPLCPPGYFDDEASWPVQCHVEFANGPRCGDGNADEQLESHRLCPQDFASPSAVCGDFLCEAGETSTTCPGDC